MFRLSSCLPFCRPRLAALAGLIAAPALADLSVSYVDSYPDIITITNRSGCDLGPFRLVIDLGRSPAGLIFDTSAEGAGFAGHAALEIIGGGEQVLGLGRVTDGDRQLVLDLDFLGAEGSVVLAVDVDDTSPVSLLGQTIVAGAEIAGATAEAQLSAGGPVQTGTFGVDGRAVVPLEACIS